MHTCLRREAWLSMDMLPGILLTPARQGGRKRERAGPQVRASVHRFHGKGDEVCWRASLIPREGGSRTLTWHPHDVRARVLLHLLRVRVVHLHRSEPVSSFCAASCSA
eukprot:3143138-Pleurochrysis_carterae.AAC.1